MTETEISKVLIEGEYATIMGVKYKRVEEQKPKMEFSFGGKFEVVSYNGMVYFRLEFPDEFYWYKKKYSDEGVLMVAITDGETCRLLEGLWFNEVKKGKYDDVTTTEPYCPDEPEYYDEVEWDEKDNPNIQKIIDKMVEERKSQKLWKKIRDELGYTMETCDKIVDVVEEWLPKEQSSSGSQNVNTELLVEGFNDAIRKMKEMLS
jgi:hypothetical protein